MINFICRSKSLYCFVQPVDEEYEFFVHLNIGYLVGRYRAGGWVCAGYGRGTEDILKR